MKTIQLKVTKIKYRGDSVGDDIVVQVSCLGSNLDVKKKIKNKSEVKTDAIVGEFVTDQKSFILPVNIKIIERDILFNDIVGKKIDLNVDLDNYLTQISTHEILVKELRSPSSKGGRTGIFEVTLEILVSENIFYIPITNDGWFVYYKGSKKVKTSLPSYLKIHFDKIESEKEYFTVMEGVLQGMQFWSNAGREKLSLLNKNPQTGPIDLTYSISKKTLKLGNKTYLTTDSPSAPWTEGLYDIEIPDYPHEGGLHYKGSKYARAWFRIGHSGDKYLHTGAHSLGCMTVVEVDKWDEIFGILIKARKGDGKSVGVLKVVN